MHLLLHGRIFGAFLYFMTGTFVGEAFHHAMCNRLNLYITGLGWVLWFGVLANLIGAVRLIFLVRDIILGNTVEDGDCKWYDYLLLTMPMNARVKLSVYLSAYILGLVMGGS